MFWPKGTKPHARAITTLSCEKNDKMLKVFEEIVRRDGRTAELRPSQNFCHFHHFVIKLSPLRLCIAWVELWAILRCFTRTKGAEPQRLAQTLSYPIFAFPNAEIFYHSFARRWAILS